MVLIVVYYGAEADVMKYNDMHIDFMLFIIIDSIVSVCFVIIEGIIHISILKLSFLFLIFAPWLQLNPSGAANCQKTTPLKERSSQLACKVSELQLLLFYFKLGRNSSAAGLLCFPNCNVGDIAGLYVTFRLHLLLSLENWINSN